MNVQALRPGKQARVDNRSTSVRCLSTLVGDRPTVIRCPRKLGFTHGMGWGLGDI